MARFILKHQGKGSQDDFEKVLQLPGFSIIDQTDLRAMLVEADPQAIKHNADSLTNWTIAPETSYPVPDAPDVKLR